MLFNIAIYAGLFLASEALAASVPSGLAARTNATSNGPFNYNWAGAAWAKPPGTFTVVTGTFTVPTISGPVGSAAVAWVGIDGDTCKNGVLQAGVNLTVTAGGAIYNAWYEWYPAPPYGFPGFAVAAGDVIRATVEATSKTSGTVRIENLTNGQSVSEDLISIVPLCLANAEWIIEDPLVNGELVPLANFGAVTFTDARAGAYTPSGAIIVNIEQNGRVLTSVSTSGSSVTIKYV